MIRRLLMVLALLGLFVAAAPIPYAIAATDPFGGVDCSADRNKDSTICNSKVGPDDNPIAGKDGILIKISRIVTIIAGAAAIIIIIIGGIRYITSGGDANNAKSARSTVLYALIGLAVIVLAQSLIEFVLSRL